jgi:hypothetical protein
MSDVRAHALPSPCTNARAAGASARPGFGDLSDPERNTAGTRLADPRRLKETTMRRIDGIGMTILFTTLVGCGGLPPEEAAVPAADPQLETQTGTRLGRVRAYDVDVELRERTAELSCCASCPARATPP